MRSEKALPEHWSANWIWLNDSSEGNFRYAHARRCFETVGEIQSARLNVAANNLYRLYVNGALVGRGPDRSDHRFPYFDTYDIRNRLVRGKNVIALDLYCITTTGDRGRSWSLYGGGPGLLLQLDYAESGETKRLCTDGTWRMIESPAWRKDAPRISRFLGHVEHYDADAARTLGAYTALDYDDSAWETPALLGAPPKGPLGEPLPKEIPFLHPRRRMAVSAGSIQHGGISPDNPQFHLGFSPDAPPAVATPTGSATTLTFDFGRTMGGTIEVALEECCGGRMEIHCGESDTRILTDIVELPSSGSLVYSTFDWRGARHVAFVFHNVPRPTVVRSVCFVEMEYPYSNEGEFEASDPLLGEIWRACRLTAQVATKDHPQDCVHREQALWVADLYVHAQAVASCFGDLAPFIKACRQMARTVTPDGVLSVPGPCAEGYHYGDNPLPWSEQPLAFPRLVARIYDHTGADELPRYVVTALRKIMDRFTRYEDDRGLLRVDKPGVQALSVFAGWSAMLKQEGIPLCANAEYVMALRDSAVLMRVLGDTGKERDYTDRAARAAEALSRLFYSQDDHLFVDGEKEGRLFHAFSPTANALAVLAGLLPESERGAWAHAMENHPQLSAMASPFDASMALEAYFAVGADDAARRLLQDCWGTFVEMEEPCVPERWQRGCDSMLAFGHKSGASRCHPYGAGPAYLLHRHVLGVRPVAPGWREVEIAPRHLGLRHAMGRAPTPRGNIEVFWRRDPHEWYLDVVLPQGVRAVVTLPRFGWGPGEMTCDGEIVWSDSGWKRFIGENRRTAHDDVSPGVRAVITTPGRHVLVMRSRVSCGR